ncbi:MAG: rRNA pseudouridine synthase [Clostridia bacterium]|nr:rRNA pseudouridine synthase [Clostridia bacterium]
MRINKFIAQSGITSRRKADELILQGKVKVNGAVLTEPGYDCKEDDLVEVDGKIVKLEAEKVYYLLNKPTGYVTTAKDQSDRPIILDLMEDVDQRVFPVGRLDMNTSGIIIMTNDGDLSYKVSHPKHNLYKTYRALISGELTMKKLAKLERGVDIGGYITAPAKVKVVKKLQNSTVVEISIMEGKNRQVRKMFKAVGNPVQELERIAIGNIKIGKLSLGHYRKLRPDEIEYLKGI